jgi:hypothetical protein
MGFICTTWAKCIWPYGRGNGDNTIDVLKRLRDEFPDRPMTVIWDGAPYHRSQVVFDVAAELNIHIQQLPAYSPDFRLLSISGNGYVRMSRITLVFKKKRI